MRPSKDIIDKISYDFAYATGLGSVVVDLNGKEISPWYNFTSFCQHVRKNAAFYPYCQQCDRSGGLESSKLKQVNCYRCHAGLVDFSIPIVINDSLVGFLACGQARVTDDSPIPNILRDNNDMRKESQLSDLYHEVPVMNLMKVRAAAQLLNVIVENYLCKQYDVRIIKNIDPDDDTETYVGTSDIHRAKIEKIVNYINQNFSDNLNLEQMANMANLSQFYFSRLFKRLLGVGFNSYLNNKRMNEARYLLEKTEWSIDKIARNVGFCDSPYFARSFKKSFGLSPKVFRQTSSGQIMIQPSYTASPSL